ncbi:uncharacterized protein SONE68_2140 [Lacticaseibacillus paracasei]|nr:uncharacterized protein SONE68_2140 [Lacticaseibacillus paracasei]
MRYPKRAYTFSVDYFLTPESVDPKKTTQIIHCVVSLLWKLFLSAAFVSSCVGRDDNSFAIFDEIRYGNN